VWCVTTALIIKKATVSKLQGVKNRSHAGIDDIISVLQQNRLQWYGQVLRKENNVSSRPRGRPKRTWREVVEKDYQACKLNKEDAVE